MQKTKVSPNTVKSSSTIDANRKTGYPVFRFLFSLPFHCCRYTFIYLLLIPLTGIFFPSGAEAASFTIYSTATLNPVQVNELGLSGSGTAYSQGSYDADVTWEGVVTNPLTSLDQVIAGSTAQRSDILLWHYQFNKKTEPEPTFTPTYRIFSRNGGIENKLSHSTYTSSTVNASITTQPIISMKYSGNTWRAYGYATIIVDLSTARRSGTYRGTIQISIVYI
jgi:hypothetical protein